MVDEVQREDFDLHPPEGHRVRRLWRRILWRLIAPLPDRYYIAIKYWMIIGRWPNLERPKTFTEKVQARKLHDRDPVHGLLVDKAAVKDFIAERVGNDHVVPTCWIGSSLADADWDRMPYPVVVKPTHASGLGCFIYNRADATALLWDDPGPRWLAVDHSRYNREWAYSQVPPQIIIERMLLVDGKVPSDYRFFTFDGKVSHIGVDIRRHNHGFAASYSRDWQRMPVSDPDYEAVAGELARPANLERMIEIAEALARGIDFVRVDLYTDGDFICVGELTLYPDGGFERFDPPQFDLIIGDKWKMPDRQLA